MRHSLPIAPQFYVTAPQPCPYLAGRLERKLFTSLEGDKASAMNDSLSKQGFRRSQNVLYRPACAECSACMSARIDVSKFTPSKSQKRVLQRNSRLRHSANAPWATEAQFDLFRSYLDARHSDGGMSDMDIFEFAAMIEETPVKSRVIEFSDQNDDLKAVCLTDVLDDGLSMVYSFFDTGDPRLSLGTFIILDHIRIAKEAGLPYVYLGYWVPGSPKMHYKTRFKGVEVFQGGQWKSLQDDFSYDERAHVIEAGSISDQVSQISLPDLTLISGT